jgi:hypothetical protein
VCTQSDESKRTKRKMIDRLLIIGYTSTVSIANIDKKL